MTIRRAKWGCLGLVVGVVWSVGGVGLAAELPEAMQMDRYRLEARTALTAKDPQGAIRVLKDLETVTSERAVGVSVRLRDAAGRARGTAAVKKGHGLLVEVKEKIEEMGKGGPVLPTAATWDRDYALKKKEEEAFVWAVLAGTAEAYAEYLAAYPQGPSAKEAEEEWEKRAVAEQARRWEEAEQVRQAKLKELLGGQMVHVQGGTFRMGCTAEQGDCDSDQKPVHEVRVSDFEIGRYEVTQAVWEAVVGEMSYSDDRPEMRYVGDCPQCPVEGLSWEDVQIFLERLNARLGEEYRLPTEAEWEYAARGGRKSQGDQYAGSEVYELVDSGGGPVGETRPNELGLYDMLGKEWEWTQDCWNDNYRGAPADGGAWASGDCSQRVLRGGHWDFIPTVYYRVASVRDAAESGAGVRLAAYPQGPHAKEAEEKRKKRAAAEEAARWEAERSRQVTLKELGETFQMVRVQGGTFRMGCTAGVDCIYTGDEERIPWVRVSDFEIGKYEVTQAVWAAVMGENPSIFKGCPQCPVERVSWGEVQVFLKRLKARLGEEYRLPTAAEWEYAARGGRKSIGYKYAGSDRVESVGWYAYNGENNTQPVGQKQPNELGLYDMSGNVWELACWNDNYRGAPAEEGAWEIGDCLDRVLLGGSWSNKPERLSVGGFDEGIPDHPDFRVNGGFRLARTLTPVAETNLEALAAEDRGAEEARQAEEAGRAEEVRRAEAERARQATPEELKAILTFQMVHVQGGTFRRGCTAEQEVVAEEGEQGECFDDEKPVHEVEVSDFEIGRYEVTQAVWEAVMGENPSYFEGCPQCPVGGISWEDVQEFLKELNAMLGEEYRLPTEAEWEYAARGGRQSQGYAYAGSDKPDAVAWYYGNSGRRLHPVGEKRPNELGLYDMSGNVGEWVADCWHESYEGAPSDGGAWASGDCSSRALRGGSWRSEPGYLRSAIRSWNTAGGRNYDLGFRLARTRTP